MASSDDEVQTGPKTFDDLEQKVKGVDPKKSNEAFVQEKSKPASTSTQTKTKIKTQPTSMQSQKEKETEKEKAKEKAKEKEKEKEKEEEEEEEEKQKGKKQVNTPASSTKSIKLKKFDETLYESWSAAINKISSFYFAFKFEKFRESCIANSEFKNGIFSPFSLEFALTILDNLYRAESKGHKEIAFVLQESASNLPTVHWNKLLGIFEDWRKLDFSKTQSRLSVQQYVCWNIGKLGPPSQEVVDLFGKKVKWLWVQPKMKAQLLDENIQIMKQSDGKITNLLDETNLDSETTSISFAGFLFFRWATPNWFSPSKNQNHRFYPLLDSQETEKGAQEEEVVLSYMRNTSVPALWLEVKENSEISELSINPVTKEKETKRWTTRISFKLIHLIHPAPLTRFHFGIVLPNRKQNFCDFIRDFTQTGGPSNYLPALLHNNKNEAGQLHAQDIDITIPLLRFHFKYTDLSSFGRFAGLVEPFIPSEAQFDIENFQNEKSKSLHYVSKIIQEVYFSFENIKTEEEEQEQQRRAETRQKQPKTEQEKKEEEKEEEMVEDTDKIRVLLNRPFLFYLYDMKSQRFLKTGVFTGNPTKTIRMEKLTLDTLNEQEEQNKFKGKKKTALSSKKTTSIPSHVKTKECEIIF